MSREETTKGSDKVYYTVFSGAFRTRVREGTEGALTRVNKNNKEVYEREVSALCGRIEDVAFEDSDYGKQLKITLDANEQGLHPVLSFGVESKDGRDLLRKLPAIDLSQEVRIAPYSFIPEGETEKRTGISITQPDENGDFVLKVDNHFFDKEKKEYKHGHPVIDWDLASESEQKIYKIKRDEFLVNYTKEHVIPSLQGDPMAHFPTASTVPQDDFIPPHDADGVPF